MLDILVNIEIFLLYALIALNIGGFTFMVGYSLYSLVFNDF